MFDGGENGGELTVELREEQEVESAIVVEECAFTEFILVCHFVHLSGSCW